MVRTLAAVEALKRDNPLSRIGWVVEDVEAGAVQGVRSVDKVYVLPRSRWSKWLKSSPSKIPTLLRELRDVLRQIRRDQWDIALDFQGILKSGLFSLFSGCPVRYGYPREYCKEFNWLFSNRKVTPNGQRVNRFEKNQSLVGDFVRGDMGDVQLPVSENPPQPLVDFVSLLDKSKASGLRVAVHPGTERPLKRWPTGYFSELCELMAGMGNQVILTWGPGEKPLVREIADHCNGLVYISPETRTVKEFAWLAQQCDMFVSVDTGTMHVVSALKVPVVSLFGPTDPVVIGPYQQPHRALWLDLDCSPCKERGCPFDHRCMVELKPDRVFREVTELAQELGLGAEEGKREEKREIEIADRQEVQFKERQPDTR